MRTTTIGQLEVSAVGLGCNNFGRRVDAAGTARVVSAALDGGVTLFDTADIYGDALSEEFLGKALGSRRDEVVVATKFGMEFRTGDPKGGAHPDYVRSSCEDSLRRLGTDRIDLYQLHTPDESVPIAETLGALTELRDAGKVREIGCSNFSAAQIGEAIQASSTGSLASFVSVQNQWSLLHREPEADGVAAACARHGLAVLPFFPLGRGLLTGKYRRDQPPPPGSRLADPQRGQAQLNERNFDVVEALAAFCEARGRSLLELAISWLAGQPVVASVIAGATKPEQVQANIAAASWELSPEERAVIDRLAPAEPVASA